VRTVTFKSVYEAVVRLAGLDESDSSFAQTRKDFIADCINRAVRECWEYEWWPELCVTESRTLDSNYVEDLDTSGATSIGEVEGVYSKDPFLYPDSAKSWPFVITEDGIQVQDTAAGTTVYVKYRRRPNQFTMTAWTEGTDYAEEALVYYATLGECYQVQDVSGTLTWVWVAMPFVFSTAVIRLACAEYLRNTGQAERAAAERALGLEELEKARVRAIAGQGMASRCAVRVE
jgi:hypothetical protein